MGGGRWVESNRKSTDKNQEPLLNWNYKLEMFMPLFLFTSQGEVSSLGLPDSRSMCRMLVSVLQSDTNWKCMEFEMVQELQQ